MEKFEKFWYLLPKKDADAYFVSVIVDNVHHSTDRLNYLFVQ